MPKAYYFGSSFGGDYTIGGAILSRDTHDAISSVWINIRLDRYSVQSAGYHNELRQPMNLFGALQH